MRLFRRGAPASTLDLLVAGLGNPGPRYERDRHNVGWMVVDELARRRDASFKAKFNGRLGETRLDGHRLALLKPETYMNESGRSIAASRRRIGGPCDRSDREDEDQLREQRRRWARAHAPSVAIAS